MHCPNSRLTTKSSSTCFGRVESLAGGEVRMDYSKSGFRRLGITPAIVNLNPTGNGGTYEDAKLRFNLLLTSWVFLPIAILSLVFIRAFSMLHVVVLFSPCLISALSVLIARWIHQRKKQIIQKCLEMLILTLSTAQIVCDCFFVAFVYFQSRKEVQDERQKEGGDSFTAVIMLVTLFHALFSFSLFLKFVLKLHIN